MTAFALTHKARADLSDIARFTGARWGRAPRNLYLKQLDDAVHLLAANPRAGTDCALLRSGYHKFAQGSHVIYYRAGRQSPIEIVRILHKSRDVDAL